MDSEPSPRISPRRPIFTGTYNLAPDELARVWDDGYLAGWDEGRAQPTAAVDAGLRREALDWAVRTCSHAASAADVIKQADAFLAYLRGEAIRALSAALGDFDGAEQEQAGGRPSTEGDGGAPDDLHALLDFVWSHTTEEASGLVSLQGSEVQREAESYLDEHGGELLRWEHQVLTVTMRIASAERQKREAGR